MNKCLLSCEYSIILPSSLCLTFIVFKGLKNFVSHFLIYPLYTDAISFPSGDKEML